MLTFEKVAKSDHWMKKWIFKYLLRTFIKPLIKS